MRIVDFSEFAYGHAVTREVERLLCTRDGELLLGAPDLPSLRRERQLGYDVRIDTNATTVALQFKLGEHISRQMKGSPTWHHPTVGAPHFRVHFAAGHHQLALMQALESSLAGDLKRSLVYYVAPAFKTSNEFNVNYVQERVIENSYSCHPSRVPQDGSDHHLVRVLLPHARTMMCSEPVDVGDDALAGVLREVAASREHPAVSSDAGGGVPDIVLRTEQTLREFMPDRVYVDFVERRAAESFPERPDLEHASIAIDIGSALGIFIGFTATDR